MSGMILLHSSRQLIGFLNVVRQIAVGTLWHVLIRDSSRRVANSFERFSELRKFRL